MDGSNTTDQIEHAGYEYCVENCRRWVERIKAEAVKTTYEIEVAKFNSRSRFLGALNEASDDAKRE